jgi:peptidoglycan hydrolase-like protein with peptidoglycan-binding domain
MTNRITAAGVVVALVATSGGVSWWGTHRPPAPIAPVVPTATAPVVRTDLVTTVQVSGHLQYAGDRSVPVPGAGGTLTARPRLGQVVSRGQTLFEVDGHPVLLAYGRRPAWRSLGLGASRGPDVRQLEQNLVALGFADTGTLTVDTRFTQATAAAVRRWQAARGRPRTGRIDLGALVFASGPVRISGLPVALGGRAEPGMAVLEVTSPTVSVAVDVPAAQAYRVRVGDSVTVTLPAGNSSPGRVQSVSSVAESASDPASPDQGPGPTSSTVRAVVKLSRPAATGTLDQAPVTVSIVGQEVRDAVAVPVTALVALAGGGVGVYLREGRQRTLVAVTPGLYTDTQVQVTGASVHPGELVEVPTG